MRTLPSQGLCSSGFNAGWGQEQLTLLLCVRHNQHHAIKPDPLVTIWRQGLYLSSVPPERLVQCKCPRNPFEVNVCISREYWIPGNKWIYRIWNIHSLSKGPVPNPVIYMIKKCLDFLRWDELLDFSGLTITTGPSNGKAALLSISMSKSPTKPITGPIKRWPFHLSSSFSSESTTHLVLKISKVDDRNQQNRWIQFSALTSIPLENI